jgi:hypothetical protein
MPQTPQTMFADQGYEGWETLSPYEKVERMMSIHKTGHEGEDVSSESFRLIVFSMKFQVLDLENGTDDGMGACISLRHPHTPENATTCVSKK